jgi:anaerobic selenocysteine-containing dehydrogenase
MPGARCETARSGPRDIGTEVLLMPAALSAEKAGSITKTYRLLRWHDKVVSGPCDSRSETWFMFHRGRRPKQLYAGSTDPQGCRAWSIDLGLRDRRRGGRAFGGGGAQRDELLYLAGAPPDREFPTAQRRRQDRLRRVALLRRLPKGGG